MTELQRIKNLERVKARYHSNPDVKAATKARANAWEKSNRPARLVIEHRYRHTNPEKYLLQSSRGNAKKRGIEHTISVSDIVIPELCPVFLIPFRYDTRFAPSLDRIDNSKGYVPGNVQVISRKANMMKHDATQDELRRFAEWILS